MDRRTFLVLAGGTLLCPSRALAQTGRTYRVGMGIVGAEPGAKPFIDSFLAGMNDHGYAVGRNLIFDVRYAYSDLTRLPALVDELIALKPHVLTGFETVAQVMRSKTSVIPIDLTSSSDPVGLGLAQSLARPGGNVTGVSLLWEHYPPKHIEIFREILPKLSRLGLFVDTTFTGSKAGEANARNAARQIGVTIVPYYVANRADVEQAFAAMEKDRLDAFTFAGGSAILLHLRPLVAERAMRLRLPFSSMVGTGTFVAIFSYGPNTEHAFRDAARYVDKILKGAKPSDLPIEQPTRFEMVVNLKTARALGLKIPQSVMLRADRVIE